MTSMSPAIEPGLQAHLGGGLVTVGRGEAGRGRTARGPKIPAADLRDDVERVVRTFLAGVPRARPSLPGPCAEDGELSLAPPTVRQAFASRSPPT